MLLFRMFGKLMMKALYITVQVTFGILPLQRRGINALVSLCNARYREYELNITGNPRPHSLGNPYSNYIPKCQLKWLEAMLNQCTQRMYGTSKNDMTERLAFWLDALCVPLEAPFRQQAIAKMRDTYENAAVVLVIDEGMLHFRGHLFLRVQCMLQSNWMTRLWTYQESILASRLFVAFADGLYDIRDLAGGVDRFYDSKMSNLMLPFHRNFQNRRQAQRRVGMAQRQISHTPSRGKPA